MQVYPTICMKTKGEKKETWVSPTMLMKTSMLSVLSDDVIENKGVNICARSLLSCPRRASGRPGDLG